MTDSGELAEAAARELNNEITILLMGADAIAKSLPWSMPMTHPVWIALHQMRLAALRSAATACELLIYAKNKGAPPSRKTLERTLYPSLPLHEETPEKGT